MDELNTLAVIYGRPSEMFIEQVPPYAKVPYPEAPMRSTQRSSTSHTPPPPSTTQPTAAVAPAAPVPGPTATSAASTSLGGLLDVRPVQAQKMRPLTPLIRRISCHLLSWRRQLDDVPPMATATSPPQPFQPRPAAKVDAKSFQACWANFGAGYVEDLLR